MTTNFKSSRLEVTQVPTFKSFISNPGYKEMHLTLDTFIHQSENDSGKAELKWFEARFMWNPKLPVFSFGGYKVSSQEEASSS